MNFLSEKECDNGLIQNSFNELRGAFKKFKAVLPEIECAYSSPNGDIILDCEIPKSYHPASLNWIREANGLLDNRRLILKNVRSSLHPCILMKPMYEDVGKIAYQFSSDEYWRSSELNPCKLEHIVDNCGESTYVITSIGPNQKTSVSDNCYSCNAMDTAIF